MASGEIEHPDGYDRVLADLKARVRAAQRSAQRAVQKRIGGPLRATWDDSANGDLHVHLRLAAHSRAGGAP